MIVISKQFMKKQHTGGRGFPTPTRAGDWVDLYVQAIGLCLDLSLNMRKSLRSGLRREVLGCGSYTASLCNQFEKIWT